MSSSAPLLLQWTDLFFLGVVGLSGLLAFSRGFTREVLGLLSWGVAISAGFFASQMPGMVAVARNYIEPELAAQFVTGICVFLAVLLVMSLIGMQISSLVRRAPIGTIDRFLGFCYGAVRGVFFVTILYFFYDLFVPPSHQHEVVLKARFLPVVQVIKERTLAFLPPDLQKNLRNLAHVPDSPLGAVLPAQNGATTEYRDSQRKTLDHVIEGTQDHASP